MVPIDDVFWHLVRLSRIYAGAILTGGKAALFQGLLPAERYDSIDARSKQFTACHGQHLGWAAARGGADDGGDVSDSVFSEWSRRHRPLIGLVPSVEFEPDAFPAICTNKHSVAYTKFSISLRHILSQ